MERFRISLRCQNIPSQDISRTSAQNQYFFNLGFCSARIDNGPAECPASGAVAQRGNDADRITAADI